MHEQKYINVYMNILYKNYIQLYMNSNKYVNKYMHLCIYISTYLL